MGLMTVLAHSLHVSVPVAGQLVTVYAIGVMVGAPVMTLVCGRMRIHTALLTLMAIFTAGNLFSALAVDYNALMIARIVTSLSHGAFFGLGTVAAAKIAAPGRQGSAIATVFSGLTIANILGVPAATWIGQQLGWRSAFFGSTGLGVLAMTALWLALPRSEKGRMPDLRTELRVLRRPEVLLLMGTTVTTAGAMFTLYTYVAPMLSHLAGASANLITVCLGLIGVGFAAGNLAGGRLADRFPVGAGKCILATLTALMLMLPLILNTPAGAAIGLSVWGAVTFAVMPSLQANLMKVGAEAPGLAASINIGAFNIGNAIGAFVGGSVLTVGLGYRTIPIAGAGLALIALAFASLAARRTYSRSID
jgi:DHA1 family inner membrane transport protein